MFEVKYIGDLLKPLEMRNHIVGKIITRPQYRYVDPRIISDIVQDTIAMIKEIEENKSAC